MRAPYVKDDSGGIINLLMQYEMLDCCFTCHISHFASPHLLKQSATTFLWCASWENGFDASEWRRFASSKSTRLLGEIVGVDLNEGADNVDVIKNVLLPAHI